MTGLAEVVDLLTFGVPDGPVHEIEALIAKSWAIYGILHLILSDVECAADKRNQVRAKAVANELCKKLVPRVVHHIPPHVGEGEVFIHLKPFFRGGADSHSVHDKE